MERWKVLQEESGESLQRFLKEKCGDSISAKQIKRAVDSGKCFLNGKSERFSSTLVGYGDTIEIDLSASKKELQKVIMGSAERILYSDDDLVAYDKPAGISSDSQEILDHLFHSFGHLMLLHRLDKDTTGILLFARNQPAAKAIETLFKKRLVKKTYFALVSGIPPKSSGVIENFLGKLRIYQGQTIWGVVPRDKGQYAKTAWKIKKRGKTTSLLLCYPETGRTHQIRVHLSDLGHPILGDHQYGRLFTCNHRPQRALLHAFEIVFEHPQTKQRVTIQSPVPRDFLEAVRELLLEPYE